MKSRGEKILFYLFPVSLVVLCFLLVPSAKKKTKHNNEGGENFIYNEVNPDQPTKILIQPFDKVSSLQLAFIQKEISSFYKNSEVFINASVPLPLNAWYEPRKRYVADSLLEFLNAIKTSEFDLIIGITNKDIATQKGKNPNYGIMGLGFCPGDACVVSTFRLTKKIAAKKNTEVYNHIFMDRFSKVCLHELGHNFGLPHCNACDSCLMHDANGTISQVDLERKFICKSCRNKLSGAL